MANSVMPGGHIGLGGEDRSGLDLVRSRWGQVRRSLIAPSVKQRRLERSVSARCNGNLCQPFDPGNTGLHSKITGNKLKEHRPIVILPVGA